MSWQWYDQVTLPEGTMTISVQDFVDLWAQHPKDFWDVAVDFPDLTPRFRSVFLVARAPKTVFSEVCGRLPWPVSSPRAWGVLFSALDTHRIWTDQQMVPIVGVRDPEPDEWVLRGEVAKRIARWRVVASMVEQGTTGGGSKAVRTATWGFMVSDEGSIPMVKGGYWFGPWDRDVQSLRLAEDRLKYLHPMLLAISAWNEGVAVLCDRLLPPWFQLKLRRGRLPTIGQKQQSALAS